MILKDRSLLNKDGSISVELLCRCIIEHENSASRLNKLNDYMDGKHEILNRKMAGDSSIQDFMLSIHVII